MFHTLYNPLKTYLIFSYVLHECKKERNVITNIIQNIVLLKPTANACFV